MIASIAALAIAFSAPGAATLADSPSAPAAQRGVNGNNVTRVFHSGGGSFEHTEGGRWVEFADDGTLIHEFNEERRDASRVSLFDVARGARVWINLRTREISGAPAYGRPRLLYRIVETDAGRRGRGWRGRRGQGDGGGGNWGGNGGNWGGNGGNNGGGWGRDDIRNIEVGPIWNQNDAQGKCTNKAREMRGEWTGQWRTTVQGRMSVCEIRFR